MGIIDSLRATASPAVPALGVKERPELVSIRKLFAGLSPPSFWYLSPRRALRSTRCCALEFQDIPVFTCGLYSVSEFQKPSALTCSLVKLVPMLHPTFNVRQSRSSRSEFRERVPLERGG